MFATIASIITLLIVGSASLYLVVNRVKLDKISSDLNAHEILNQNRRNEHINVLNRFTDQVNNANRVITSNLSSIDTTLKATIENNKRSFCNVNTNHYNFRERTLKKFREIDDIDEAQSILIKNHYNKFSNADERLSDRINTTNINVLNNSNSINTMNSKLDTYQSQLGGLQNSVQQNLDHIMSNAEIDSSAADDIIRSLNILTEGASNNLANKIDNVNSFFSIPSDSADISAVDFNNYDRMNFNSYIKEFYIKPYYDDNITLDTFFKNSRTLKDDFYTLSNWKNNNSTNISKIDGMITDINTNSSNIQTINSTLSVHGDQLDTIGSTVDKVGDNIRAILDNSNAINTINTSLNNLTTSVSAYETKEDAQTERNRLNNLTSDFDTTRDLVDDLKFWKTAKDYAYIDNIEGAEAGENELVLFNTVFSNPGYINAGVDVQGETINIKNIIDSKKYTDYIDRNNHNFFTITEDSAGFARVGIFDSSFDAGPGAISSVVENGTLYIEKPTVFPNGTSFNGVVTFNSNNKFNDTVEFNADVTFKSDAQSTNTIDATDVNIKTNYLELNDVTNLNFGGTTNLEDYLNANYAKITATNPGGDPVSWATTDYVTTQLAPYKTGTEIDGIIDDKLSVASTNYFKTDDRTLSALKEGVDKDVYGDLVINKNIKMTPNNHLTLQNNSTLKVDTFSKIKAANEPVTFASGGQGTSEMDLPTFVENKITSSAVQTSDINDTSDFLTTNGFAVKIDTPENILVVPSAKPFDKTATLSTTDISLENLPVVEKTNNAFGLATENSNALSNLINNKIGNSAKYDLTGSTIPLIYQDTGMNKIDFPSLGGGQVTPYIKYGTKALSGTTIPKLELCFNAAGNDTCFEVWHKGEATAVASI